MVEFVHNEKRLVFSAISFIFSIALILFGFSFVNSRSHFFLHPVYALDATPSAAIVWSKDRKLTWDDFKGAVPGDTPDDIHAKSSVGVFSKWQLTHKCENVGKSGKRKCTATVASVSAQAQFDPDNSWVKPDKKIDELLKHEQGHFDISEIFAVKKQEEMKKLVGKSETATADNDGDAITEAEGKLEKKLMEICDQINKEEGQMQEKYDKETKNGSDAEQQKKWEEKIKKLLGR